VRAWVVCTIGSPGNRPRRTSLPPLCSLCRKQRHSKHHC